MTYKGTPHAGETVDNVSGTVASDGTLTLYPMHSGNWECSCYSSVIGTTMKKTIELSYWGTTNVELKDIPDGATVTPIDDVQTWLHCANIWDKSYTTVTGVIADKTTLNALVQSENANNYLVRSTTFSTKLCENNTNNEAMYYLGLYDSCADKLLSDEHWRNAICSADVLLADGQTHLFEKVLNVSVPTMTSNTEPSGKCYFSNGEFNDNYAAWHVFDKKNSTHATSKASDTFPRRLVYDFGESKKVRIYKAEYSNLEEGGYVYAVNNAKIQGSNDETNWEDLGAFNIPNSISNKTEISCNSTNAYRYICLMQPSKNNSAGGVGLMSLTELQFYGREEA